MCSPTRICSRCHKSNSRAIYRMNNIMVMVMATRMAFKMIYISISISMSISGMDMDMSHLRWLGKGEGLRSSALLRRQGSWSRWRQICSRMITATNAPSHARHRSETEGPNNVWFLQQNHNKKNQARAHHGTKTRITTRTRETTRIRGTIRIRETIRIRA